MPHYFPAERAGTRNRNNCDTTELIINLSHYNFYKKHSFNMQTKLVAAYKECSSGAAVFIRPAKFGEQGYSFSQTKTKSVRLEARIKLPVKLKTYDLGTLEIEHRGNGFVVRFPYNSTNKVFPVSAQNRLQLEVTGVVG